MEKRTLSRQLSVRCPLRKKKRKVQYEYNNNNQLVLHDKT